MPLFGVKKKAPKKVSALTSTHTQTSYRTRLAVHREKQSPITMSTDANTTTDSGTISVPTTATAATTSQTFTTTSSGDPLCFGDNKMDKKSKKSPPQPNKTGTGKKMIIDITASDSEDSDVENPEAEDEEKKEDTEKMYELARVFGKSQFTSERAAKKVGNCSGDNPAKTLKWLRQLDEVDAPVEVAQLTAEGALAAYIRCFKKKTEWPHLRRKIAEHFISAAFQQTQKDALERLTQRPGEPLIKFNHEFLALTIEAYDELPEEQDGLIRTYLSALHDRDLAKAVLRERPTTLKDAIRATFARDRTEDFLRPRATGVTATSAPLPTPQIEALIKAVEALTQNQQTLQREVIASRAPAQVAQVKPASNKSKVVCYRCNKKGHFAKECRSSTSYNREHYSPRPRDQQTARSLKCDRCRATNHEVRNCRAGPPRRPCYCGGSHWCYDCPERRTTTQQATSTPQNQEN